MIPVKKFKRLWQRYMLRPFLYTAFSRLALGLCAALLGDHLFSDPAGRLRGILLPALRQPALRRGFPDRLFLLKTCERAAKDAKKAGFVLDSTPGLRYNVACT